MKQIKNEWLQMRKREIESIKRQLLGYSISITI